jgi:hypothetical protein
LEGLQRLPAQFPRVLRPVLLVVRALSGEAPDVHPSIMQLLTIGV